MSAAQFKLAVVGGSGFDRFPELQNSKQLELDTPYGAAAPVTIGDYAGGTLLFMPRHGPEHRLAPHKVNYRANIWALQELQVAQVLAINAVGGISEGMRPGSLVLPEQIIDYTHGREHTFFGGGDSALHYAEFAEPYTPRWRQRLLQVAARAEFPLLDGGVYGCTQGPRLETAAEIRRLKNDGCDLVGMTGMPEAGLARELQLDYAALAVVVNWAAGIDPRPITVETVYAQLQVSIEDVKRFIAAVMSSL